MDVEGKSCWSRNKCALSHQTLIRPLSQLPWRNLMQKQSALYLIMHYHGESKLM